MTEEVKEGTIRVVEWLLDYTIKHPLFSPHRRHRLEQYLGGRWVEVPVFHFDREGKLKEGRLK